MCYFNAVLARYFIVPPGAVKWRRYAVCGVLGPRERSDGEIVRFWRVVHGFLVRKVGVW